MIFLKSYKMIIIHIYSQLEALQPGNDKERLFQIVDLQVAVLQRYSYPHILGLSSVRSRFSRALWHCEAGTHSSDQLQSLEEKPFMYTIFQYSRKTVKYTMIIIILPFTFWLFFFILKYETMAQAEDWEQNNFHLDLSEWSADINWLSFYSQSWLHLHGMHLGRVSRMVWKTRQWLWTM